MSNDTAAEIPKDLTWPEGRTPRILVVDDERGTRESLRLLLQTNFQVTTAENVDQALQRFQEVWPDAVILDVRMPGQSGFEGLQALRLLDPTVSVIMLTAYASIETAQHAIRLGANDYVIKPFDVGHMLDVVRNGVVRTSVVRHRERAEKELRELVGRLLNDLNRKEREAALGRSSTEMIHDLRNPLSVILGSAQLLERDLQNVPPVAAQAQEYLAMIEKSVSRCRELVESWLESGSQGRRSSEPVMMGAVIREVMDLAAPLASTREVRLVAVSAIEDGCVAGDRIQISRILQNLVGNALDAVSAHTGEVAMSGARAGDTYRVTVADNGCGMDAATLANAFEPYFSTKEPGRGTGLGLFIARKVVEDHGGTIGIESQPGAGTKVTVTLPLALAPTAHPPAAENQTPPSPGAGA